MKRSATFSNDRKYRYVLHRSWDINLESVLFIGLNPSKADEESEDPTIRRLIGFTKKWNFGSFYVCNLYAYCTPYPKELFSQKEPIGELNDFWINKIQKKSSKTVLIYGNMGRKNNRDLEFLDNIKTPLCIKLSKYGMPMHPLYLKYTESPISYKKDYRIKK